MRILIVGSGGREEAFEKALRPKAEVFQIPWTTVPDVVAQTKINKVELVLIGPEAPLAAGLVDRLTRLGIAAVGPTQAAAQLETSKIWGRTLATWIAGKNPEAAYVPEYAVANEFALAEKIIQHWGVPIVIKKNGLHGGKGVTIAKTIEQAHAAAEEGLRTERILIEQKLEGKECSLFYLCDGSNAVYFGSACDYKLRDASDDAPMTGGMGAYAPANMIDRELIAYGAQLASAIMTEMCEMGMPLRGFFYISLMLVEKDGVRVPYIIEFNVRFGDPEAQVILPLINEDILPYLIASTNLGGLEELPPLTFKPQKAVGVVLADKGYPEPGNKRRHTLVGLGDTYADARAEAYAQIRQMDPAGMYRYRTDIAAGL